VVGYARGPNSDHERAGPEQELRFSLRGLDAISLALGGSTT
jgi:hypothetical protein